MQWLGEPWAIWVLVGAGGAAGSALGVLLMRRPSPRRLLVGIGALCGLWGVFSAYPYWPAVTAPLTVGVIGSAASMVAVSTAPPLWLDSRAIRGTMLSVIKRIAVYCAVGVACALSGYLAVRAGTTLYVKLR